MYSCSVGIPVWLWLCCMVMWTLGHIRMDSGWRRKHVRKKGYETGDQADDGGTGEDGEEKSPTNDEMVSIADMSILLDAMRAEQNETLAQGRFYQASQTQQAIMTFLTASSGRNPVGMSMLVTWIRGVFQRLYWTLLFKEPWKWWKGNRLPKVCGRVAWCDEWKLLVRKLGSCMNLQGQCLENASDKNGGRTKDFSHSSSFGGGVRKSLMSTHAQGWHAQIEIEQCSCVLISMACAARQDPQLVSPLLPGMSERKWTKLWAERIGSKWVAGWTESSRETNGVVGCGHMSLA